MSRSDAQLKAMLASKDQSQLISFIKEKGQERKNKLFESTKFQTEDWSKTTAQLQRLANLRQTIEEDRAEFEKSVKTVDLHRSHEHYKIAEMEKKLKQDQAELASIEQESTQKLQSLESGNKTTVEQVTVKLINDINKVLENSAPQDLVAVLENFVRLLRNKEDVNNADVQLYFADHAKLVSQMHRTNPYKAVSAVVQQSKEAIVSLKESPLEGANGDNAPIQRRDYQCFVQWSFDYIQAAELAIQLQTLRDSIKDLQLKLEHMNSSFGRFKEMEVHRENHHFDELFGLRRSQLEAREEIFKKIESLDQRQASNYQLSLKKFEDNYFKEYIKAVQETSM